jgi:hypothetical protein
MPSIVFANGTLVPAAWLNDVNNIVYNATAPGGGVWGIGPTAVTGTFSVSGTVTLGGQLSVAGLAAFANVATFALGADFGGESNFAGPTNFSGLSTFNGAVTAASTVGVTGLSTLSGGAKVGNTAVASVDVLDYYLEETWTPALTFGGGNTGMTVTTQTGIYTRIGRMVWFRVEIQYSAKGSSTGVASISGLPFAGVDANGTPVQVVATGMNALTGVMSGTAALPGIGGGTTITLQQSAAGGLNVTNLFDTFFGATLYLVITGTYRVS